MSNETDNIPTWVDSKLFETVLRETVDDFDKVLSFKALHALAPGENYATLMVKVETEVQLKNGKNCVQSFMLKVPHESELYRKEMSKWNMFATESGMYQEVVPEMEQMYKERGLEVKFGAKSYKLPTQREYILLENLTQKGFKNAPRLDCLDLIHCKSVLKKLAQWHAASAVRVEQKGSYKYNYAKGIFIENGKEMLKTMMESNLKHLINTASKLPNHEEYLEQLEGLRNKTIDLFCTPSTFDVTEFNILNHGDCWSNNIMFQYDQAGNLQETYLVDLQVPGYGSPAQDLLYFIITSAQLDIKIKKFDYMIKYYYDNLIEHLKLLKFAKPLPTLKELHISLVKHGQWGFFAALVTMAAVLCDPTDKASVDNFMGDCKEADKFKELMYTNSRYVSHIEVLLPWLCNKGVFQLPS